MSAPEKALHLLERAGRAATVALMLAIMAVVFTDVMLRHFANRPLTWAYDLVGMYLLTGVYFLDLSDSYAANAHVGIDLIVRKLPEAGRRASELVTCAAGIALFALIAYTALDRAVTSYVNGEAVSGLIAWPTWISPALVAAGSALLVLRLAFRLVGNALSLALGRPVVAPPPTVGLHRGE